MKRILFICICVLSLSGCEEWLLQRKNTDRGSMILSFEFENDRVYGLSGMNHAYRYDELDSVYVYSNLESEKFGYILMALSIDDLQKGAKIQDPYIVLSYYRNPYVNPDMGGRKAEIQSATLKIRRWDEDDNILSAKFEFDFKMKGGDDDSKIYKASDGYFDMRLTVPEQ